MVQSLRRNLLKAYCLDKTISYVDAMMAGLPAIATTGMGNIASILINMAGAAIEISIKGEVPTHSVISAGLASVIGHLGMKTVGKLSPIAVQTKKDIIGAVTDATAYELTSKVAKK